MIDTKYYESLSVEIMRTTAAKIKIIPLKTVK